MLMLTATRRRTAVLVLLWAAFCAWAVWGWATLGVMRAPQSEFVRRGGGYEVRSYPAALAAQVLVNGSWTQAADRGGRLLRTYASSAAVPDVAPLVHEERADGSWLVSYLLPGRYTQESAPRPDDPQIRMVTVPAVTAAVVRFSGGSDAVRNREAELRAVLAEDGVLVTGAARIVRYEGRLIPPFLRRNELILPIRP